MPRSVPLGLSSSAGTMWSTSASTKAASSRLRNSYAAVAGAGAGAAAAGCCAWAGSGWLMPVVAAAAPPTTAVFRKSRRPKFCSVMVSSRSLRLVQHRMTCLIAAGCACPVAPASRLVRIAAMRSGGGVALGPFAPHGDQERHDGGTEEQADQPECLEAAKDAEQHPEERHAGRAADQDRPHEVI